MSRPYPTFSLSIHKKEVCSFIHQFTRQEYEKWLLSQPDGAANVLISRSNSSSIFITNSLHIEIPSEGDARFSVFGDIKPLNAFCSGMDYVNFLNSAARKEVRND